MRLARSVTVLSAAILAAAAAATSAAAQITPPNIRKPIDAAKKAAGATSAQIQSAQKVGDEAKQGTLPAAAARAGAKNAPSTPQEAASMRAAAAKRDADQKAAAADSASRRGSASQSGSKGAVLVYREEYAYADEGRRDPFVSLMATGELTPLFVDLSFVGVLYDQAQPSRSLALLVDGSSNLTYRVKAGQTLGRMKVERVSQREITMSIDEFGFSRRETLPLDMNSRKAGGAPGRRPQ